MKHATPSQLKKFASDAAQTALASKLDPRAKEALHNLAALIVELRFEYLTYKDAVSGMEWDLETIAKGRMGPGQWEKLSPANQAPVMNAILSEIKGILAGLTKFDKDLLSHHELILTLDEDKQELLLERGQSIHDRATGKAA